MLTFEWMTEADFIINGRIRVDANAIAKTSVSPDDYVRADPHAFANLRGRINHCAWVNERLKGRLWMEKPERARVGQIRIACAQDGDVSSDFDPFGHQDG